MKWRARALVTALAVLAAAVFAACGKKESEDDKKESDGKEFVYVPEFVRLSGDEAFGFSNFMYAGGSLYYTAYTEGEGEALYQYDLTARTARKLALPEAGERKNSEQISVDGEGNFYIIWSEYHYNEANPENSYRESSLAKYDAGLNEVFLNDITDRLCSDGDDGYAQDMALDSEGNVYISTQSAIHLLDADGSYAGVVKLDVDWIIGLGVGKNGKVCATYYDRVNGGTTASEIDYAKKSPGEKLTGLPAVNGSLMLSAGLDKDFLIADSSKLYEYDREAQTAEEVLDWLDSDINGTYVEFTCATEDGKILAVTREWGTDTAELVFLTKTKASEVQAKEEIVVGVMYMDQTLQAAAVAFNKSSDKYHVTIREYNGSGIEYEDARAKLNTDIVSKDNCPDVLAVDILDIEHLNALGAFEDLKPWLEKSSTLSEDAFMESILNAYTYDGRLICIPKTFQIATLAGKKSELGSAKGWTLRDIMAFAEAHPGSRLLEYTTKADMMELLMAFNQNAFIDWEKGTCSFDSEEFQQILEFVGSFPDDYEGSDGESTQEMLASGKLLLNSVNISGLQDVQLYPAMFGEEVTFIGYPTMDGSGGCVFSGSGSYAIASGSRHKDGAWSFLEHYLNSENEMFEWGLPTNRKRFDALVEKELDVEYVKDENGELVLDEDGNPIPEGGGGLVMDGWEYDYHPATREEIDTLLAMIEVARPISMGNQDIMKFIQEEAAAFYKGDKSAAEVAALIQSRASMYVSENK